MLTLADSISDKFVEKYKDKMPPWGPVGYVVFKRTYSRKIEGGKRKEEWWETVRRCVNGILKIGCKMTKEEAETLYDKVFNLKCSFGGRSLWQLGTATVDKLGGDSLQNCWCCCVNNPVESFCFLFDELMLGGGVGLNIQAEHVYEMPKVKYDVKVVRRDEKDVDFVVPDNREGWVDLLRRTLQAFFFTGKSFCYSTICVRGKGAPIKGFGGVASGPEDLCWGIEQIANILRSRVGKKLRPIDCLDICNIIGAVVVAGNVRRSAEIMLGDANDDLYLDAKNWGKGQIPNWRSKSNNSVICNHFDELPSKFWSGYNGEGEAYGLVNLRNCRAFGRLTDGKDYRLDKNVVGTNPCVVGDTLVYVADGRGNVPIRRLAAEGKDVPVFCLDDQKKVVIRHMRNPRVTGVLQPIKKITLENGHVLRVTANHKFLTSEGQHVEAGKLKVGDGLRTLCRYEASIKDIFPSANSNSQDYLWLKFGTKPSRPEHRLVAEFFADRKIVQGELVHHKDYNAKNNAPSNLEIMKKIVHDHLHRDDKIGDKNPMRRAKTEWSEDKWAGYRKHVSDSVKAELNGRYCGQTNDDLKKHAMLLCQKFGRRFSREEWQVYAKENGIPQNFSKWRKDHLNGICSLAAWAASELGFDKEMMADLDVRTLRLYKNVLADGYDAFIADGHVFVRKKCEFCGNEFTVSAQQREAGLCSSTCANLRSWAKPDVAEKRKKGMKIARNKRMAEVRESQLAIFLKTKAVLGRTPEKREWQQACKQDDASFEISRVTSPFRYWRDLKQAAETFNHRIVSIEDDGIEDVYNGTVDEFHNFFMGGFEEKTKNCKRKYLYCNTLQCGEVPLNDMESCNLAELFLPNIADEAEFKQCAELMFKVVKSISYLPFIHEGTNAVVKENHRLGIGVTGFLQAGHLRNEKVFDNVYKHIEKMDREYSKQNGLKPSIKLTTVKPSGSLSLLAGVTSGGHPGYSPYYIRRIEMDSTDPLVAEAAKHGYHVEPKLMQDGTRDLNTMVVEFPVKLPDGTICAKDLTAIQQMDWAKWLQTHWSDNSVSVTVYYKKEELPAIKDWLKENYDKHIKTLSFCLHSDHGYKQAPFEEISKEKYEELVAKVKPIVRIASDEGDETLKGNLECSSASCPVR